MQASKPLPSLRQQGFTLIELSIVLVIIGLIVGGVLVGQDLIKAGQIRSQITQLSQLDTAANSFHGKYNGLPGDYNNPGAIVSGVVYGTGGAGSTGNGNGNGLIESTGSSSGTAGFAGEPAMFFAELSQAGNVFNVPITTTTFAVATALTMSSSVAPPSPLGQGNYLLISENGSYNFYLLGQFSGATSTSTGIPATATAGLTPSQALALDAKLDDGYPTTGIVLATSLAGDTAVPSGTPATNGGTAGGTAGCYNTTPTPNTYSAVTLNTVECVLAVKTTF